MSWLEQLQQAKAALAKGTDDPLRARVEAAVRGHDAISTVAVLTSIGLPPTSGNGRRIARSMRELGYVPIKSRRLPPGGWADTLCRGWARPIRTGQRTGLEQGERVEARVSQTDQHKEECRL